MPKNNMTFKIGGEAGQGIESSGVGFAQALARCSLYVFGLQGYMSRIRGGHNFYQIRASESPLYSHTDEVHLLMALLPETRVATVLVSACPHALGLAIPLVVAITTSLAASSGILVRDRLALEEAREIDVVMFDKTGTLTQGEFSVVDMAAVEGWDKDQALALAAAVESDSEHTLAQGVRQAAEERELSLPQVTDFEAIKGRGVRGRRPGPGTRPGQAGEIRLGQLTERKIPHLGDSKIPQMPDASGALL